MASQMCAILQTSPLPLDHESVDGAYELMKERTLPPAVKELLDSVDSFVGHHLLIPEMDLDKPKWYVWLYQWNDLFRVFCLI